MHGIEDMMALAQVSQGEEDLHGIDDLSALAQTEWGNMNALLNDIIKNNPDL